MKRDVLLGRRKLQKNNLERTYQKTIQFMLRDKN